MRLEEIVRRWLDSRDRGDPDAGARYQAACSRARESWPEDLPWLRRALRDPDQRSVVPSLYWEGGVPETLLPDFMSVIAEAADPSINRSYVPPCTLTFGPRRMFEELIAVFARGPHEARQGVAFSIYWLGTYDRPTERDTRTGEEIPRALHRDRCDDLRARLDCMMLDEFLQNDDVLLRRALAYALSFEEATWSEELKPSVRRMIAICRDHPDEQLRTTAARKVGARVRGGQRVWPLLWG